MVMRNGTRNGGFERGLGEARMPSRQVLGFVRACFLFELGSSGVMSPFLGRGRRVVDTEISGIRARSHAVVIGGSVVCVHFLRNAFAWRRGVLVSLSHTHIATHTPPHHPPMDQSASRLLRGREDRHEREMVGGNRFAGERGRPDDFGRRQGIHSESASPHRKDMVDPTTGCAIACPAVVAVHPPVLPRREGRCVIVRRRGLLGEAEEPVDGGHDAERVRECGIPHLGVTWGRVHIAADHDGNAPSGAHHGRAVEDLRDLARAQQLVRHSALRLQVRRGHDPVLFACTGNPRGARGTRVRVRLGVRLRG